MTIAQRRIASLTVLERYEEARILFNCLAHSPALWDAEDVGEDWEDEEDNLKYALIERGLLTQQGRTCTTTDEGIKALIAYIKDRTED